MNEKLNKALEEISDAHIAEAAKPKKKLPRYLISGIAAVLAVVILITGIAGPGAICAEAVSLAADSRVTPRPLSKNYDDRDQWKQDYQKWTEEYTLRVKQTEEALSAASPLLSQLNQILLGKTGSQNRVWCPTSAYIALSMAAELAEGDTRRQLLEALGTDSTDALRTNVSALWESASGSGGLATSLWLDDSAVYDQADMDALSYYYYASVYQGDFGSRQTQKDVKTWLNQHTGGQLSAAAEKISLPANTVLALFSAVELELSWDQEFSARDNTTDTFHAADGDISCTFMNTELEHADYYWGSSFSAVSVRLEDNCKMWLILPDEDKTVSGVLTEGEYLETILHADTAENCKDMRVNLSLPKFTVDSTVSLKEPLQALGVTNAFDPFGGEFRITNTSGDPVRIDDVQQSTKLIADEEGVKGFSFTWISFGATSAAPAEDEIDFVLDRPFLFFVTNDNHVPIFAGIVNNP